MNKNHRLTIDALGIALYVVLSMTIPIRVVGNYFLCLGYLIIVAYPYLFGPMDGMIVGFFGTALYCILVSSYNGMVGWVIGNTLIGYGLGVVFSHTKGRKHAYIIDNVMIVLLTAVAFLLIKPLIETVMFRIPYSLRVAANMPAFIMDMIVMLVGYPITLYVQKMIKK